MLIHWFSTVIVAALAAWLIVCCVRLNRSEKRYMERNIARVARQREDGMWMLYREVEAELAKQISEERAS